MIALPSIPTMRRAFAKKDPGFDGIFVVAVKTTNVFCRPVCRAKPPRPQNVEFFATPQEAMRNGYRPCKLCRPLDQVEAMPEVVRRLLDLAERRAPQRVTETDLREAGVDPSTARRQFKRYCGMTFAGYQRSRRLGRALQDVSKGSGVMHAQAGAGFESASGFREAFKKAFGTPASQAGEVTVLSAQWITTPLGRMLAVAGDEGIVLLDFIDRKGLEGAIGHLKRRLRTNGAPAVVIPQEHPHLSALRAELSEYFAGTRREFSVPLAARGRPFENRAWDYLRKIPYGQTCSYGEQARAIGSPGAARAAGRANGMNYLAIVIPCHRVVGADGSLTGYGGGVARKRWLLEHERRVLKGRQNH